MERYPAPEAYIEKALERNNHMSQKLKEQLILITAITIAILIIIATGIIGYIAITDPNSREGIGNTITMTPFIIIVVYGFYKVLR